MVLVKVGLTVLAADTLEPVVDRPKLVDEGAGKLSKPSNGSGTT
jgi:hypothetical protein